MDSKHVAVAIDQKVRECLPHVEKHVHAQAIAQWIEWHGWSDCEDAALLVARQAVLNQLLLHFFPAVPFFSTPLDGLIPLDKWQPEEIDFSASSLHFNFWGLVHNLLISQPRRRLLGQFWTDEIVSDWMVNWLLQAKPRYLMDVGCGSGSFLLQAARIHDSRTHAMRLSGMDASPLVLNLCLANFATGRLSPPRLLQQDYLSCSLPADVDAIICNPPYTRHHQISPALKDKLAWLFKSQYRLQVSRQGTMASYFLLKIIAEMPEGARAAIILPMETLDARYGHAAKHALVHQTNLHALIHFAPEMNAFAKVDVGASILFFQKGRTSDYPVKHLTLRALPTTEQFLEILTDDNPEQPDFGALTIMPQSELERIPKWFAVSDVATASRQTQHDLVVRLKDIARVMRGIATGANDFFALPTQTVAERRLGRFVVPTIQRNREIQDILLDKAGWEALEAQGKRVWLMYLDGEDALSHPCLRDYIAYGERLGYHQRSLVNTRKQWYRMEQRDVPPIFFTILTRGNPRFILNKADVRPLNMFSLIYPKQEIVQDGLTEILWALLNSEFSLSKLHSVSRTYGGKTLKVEPRELDNLPVLNPQLFDEPTQQKFMSAIADFSAHRDTQLFLRQVNRLVESLLEQRLPAIRKPGPARQLQLLESSAARKRART
jgi:methylase of polypeptide subunit release factors